MKDMKIELDRYVAYLVDEGKTAAFMLTPAEQKKLVALMIYNKDEPFNFITETDRGYQFIYHYLNSILANTADDQKDEQMEAIIQLDQCALEYYHKQMDSLLEQRYEHLEAWYGMNNQDDWQLQCYHSKHGE